MGRTASAMSALAEALVAAQRRALSAMEKFYAAGAIDAEQARLLMNEIGLTDSVDQDRLIVALDAIRDYGAALPAEQTPTGAPKPPEPASDAQLALIARLVKEKQAQPPDLPLNKVEAHEVIDTLKAGTYDYAKWHVAF